MLKISKRGIGNKLTVALDGRLDTAAAPDLEKDLLEGLQGVTDLNIDMGKLTYISSAGLRVLLAAQKIMDVQGTMVISNSSAELVETFEDTGFIDILNLV